MRSVNLASLGSSTSKFFYVQSRGRASCISFRVSTAHLSGWVRFVSLSSARDSDRCCHWNNASLLTTFTASYSACVTPSSSGWASSEKNAMSGFSRKVVISGLDARSPLGECPTAQGAPCFKQFHDQVQALEISERLFVRKTCVGS